MVLGHVLRDALHWCVLDEHDVSAHRTFETSRRFALHSTAMDGGGDGRSFVQKAWDVAQEVPTWIVSKAKPAFHYGFIPFIIVVGMNTEPKPTWSQLLGPM